MLRKPKKFMIGHVEWKIKWSKRKSQNSGLTCYKTNTIFIYLKNNVNEDNLRDTLLHELLHVCFGRQIDGVLTSNKESIAMAEDIIELLTPRLLEVFIVNPQLRKFIFKSKTN